ncbi:hypothetical protein Hanom_Chr10g00907351 [Helianthus anomalus]
MCGFFYSKSHIMDQVHMELFNGLTNEPVRQAAGSMTSLMKTLILSYWQT